MGERSIYSGERATAITSECTCSDPNVADPIFVSFWIAKEEKDFLRFPLRLVEAFGLAGQKSAIGRWREESFHHAVGRPFRTCGVGSTLRGRRRPLPGGHRSISSPAFGAASRAAPAKEALS